MSYPGVCGYGRRLLLEKGRLSAQETLSHRHCLIHLIYIPFVWWDQAALAPPPDVHHPPGHACSGRSCAEEAGKPAAPLRKAPVGC